MTMTNKETGFLQNKLNNSMTLCDKLDKPEMAES